jgi:hypothetical protein
MEVAKAVVVAICPDGNPGLPPTEGPLQKASHPIASAGRGELKRGFRSSTVMLTKSISTTMRAGPALFSTMATTRGATKRALRSSETALAHIYSYLCIKNR